jgi:HSP20 family protein
MRRWLRRVPGHAHDERLDESAACGRERALGRGRRRQPGATKGDAAARRTPVHLRSGNLPEEAIMALVRYRPRRNLATWPILPDPSSRLGRVIEQFLDDAVEDIGWSPAVDVVEHDGELRVTAELPGMKLDDVHVEVADGMLHIRGEKEAEAESGNGSARLIERSYGAFERSFTLPRSVDPDKVRADFGEGVLTVHLPKTESSLGRKVEIKGT